MLLILFSAPSFINGEKETLFSLFEEGLELFHLRKPKASKKQVAGFIESIPDKYHSRIVIHSHYSLTREFNLKGIHLTEKEREKLSERSNSENNREHIVSTSFHSLETLKKNRKKYEYVFLSPVFDSISKQNYKAAFDLKELKNELPGLKKRKNNSSEVIALGGINAENIEKINQLGFDGAAILGVVWESKDPVQVFREIKIEMEK